MQVVSSDSNFGILTVCRLHLIDFEQLKIENQTVNEKIEERNEELLKLRKKNTTTVQVTHAYNLGKMIGRGIFGGRSQDRLFNNKN